MLDELKEMLRSRSVDSARRAVAAALGVARDVVSPDGPGAGAASREPAPVPVAGSAAAALRTDLEEFRSRFEHASGKLRDHLPMEIRSGRLLDIGCGTGAGVAAAVACGAKVAIGVDRSLSEFTHFFAEEYPRVCERFGANPARAVLLEADLFALRFAPGSFDVALILDAIEHVPHPERFIQYAATVLRPGGYLVLDTCPLYYSPVGHHLWQWFPEATEPWAHLKPAFREQVRLRKIDEWSIQRFEELNRVTHDDVRRFVCDAGFDVVKETRVPATPERRAAFERVKGQLDLTGIQEHWLFEDWILLVGRKR